MTPAHHFPKDEALFRPSDLARLIERVGGIAESEGCSIAEAIDRLALVPAGGNAPSAESICLGEFVHRARKLRAKRNQILGTKLFRDPAWDMLLDLFAAHERREKVSVSALCYSSGVPSSTALRAVQRLEEQGMIEREGDPKDLRRSWVRATPKVLADLTTLVSLFAEAVIASAS